MSCQRFREAIVDHACGASIDPGAAAHLDSCEDCRRVHARVARDLDDVDRLLRETMAVTASPALVARVAEPPHAAAPARLWPGWWIGTAAAAALALSVYLLVPPARPGRTGTPATAGTAASAAAGTGASAAAQRPTPRATGGVERRNPVASPGRSNPGARAAHDGSRTRSAQPHNHAAGRTAAPEPVVLVDGRQAQAIARLRELASRGVLNEDTLPPALAALADLEIAPLTVSDLIISDVLAGGGTVDQQ